MQPIRRKNRRRKPTLIIKTKEQRRVSKMNATEEDGYTWKTSEGTHQLLRIQSTGPPPDVKHTDNGCTPLIQEALQWWEAPGTITIWGSILMGKITGSSTWTPVGSNNIWGSILMGKTMGCSSTTDRARKTWEGLEEGSAKPSTYTMPHKTRLVSNFTLRQYPPKLHHLSFILFISRKSKAARLYILPNFISL